MNITKITDLLSSKNVEQYYKLYLDTQWFTEVEMREFQLIKLKKLITHCYLNIPYYRNFMKLNSITPESITSLEQLSLFPIITKEIIKENYNDFIPENINKIKGVKTSQTGGTTGNILFKRNDSNTRSSVWASYKRFTLNWAGVKDRDKKIILMGGHVIGSNFKDKFKKKIISLLTNSLSFSPYDTSEKNTQNIIDAFEKNKFVLIRSYSQFLYQLAIKLKQKGLKYKVKAITTTAEPIMLEHRELFKEVFNADVFDQYGCGEIGGIAYECDQHNGMHITEERVIVEVNSNNELIITDLDNYAMPFIRYWNADQAIISDELCTCGRKSKLITQLMGRTCDYVIGVNGQILHWAYFWHLFFDSKVADKRNLTKFQVLQESKNELKIRLICDELSSEEKILLTNNIVERLGNINVSFIFEEQIENTTTGKYRPVINKLLNK